MQTIPYSVKAKDITKRIVRPIPYTIIQTMKTNQVPKDMFLASQSWIKHNPEYDYEFFDDDRCIQFIKDNYNNNILTKFMVINTGAGKADFFRWLYLYKKGGVYVDIDTVCKQSIETFDLINNRHFVSRYSSTSLKEINHNIIASTINNLLLKKSINQVVLKINKLYFLRKNLKSTQKLCGPGVIYKCLLKILNKSPNTLNTNLKIEYIINNHIYYLYRGGLLKHRYHTKDNKILELFNPKYLNYFNDCKKLSLTRYNQTYSFYYNKCHNYLKSNNININGSKIK